MTTSPSEFPSHFMAEADWLEDGDLATAALVHPSGIILEQNAYPQEWRTAEAFPGPCIFGRGAVYRSGRMAPWTVVGRYSLIDEQVDLGVPVFPPSLFTAADLSLDMRGPDPEGMRVTTIGCDVRVGRRACVERGVRIGHGAIVAACSVVTEDLPPYAVAGGNPAKVVQWRFPPDLIAELLATAWWRLPHERIATLPMQDIETCLAQLKIA
jgi:hypothetical protein